MGGLGTYFSIVTFLLFAAAVFTMARSDGWSRSGAFAVLAAATLLPFAVAFSALIIPFLVPIYEVVFGVSTVIPALVLFALAKSVSNKMRAQERVVTEGKSA